MILKIILLGLLGSALGQDCTNPNYTDHPLILISMDGFRYDYLSRGLNPFISNYFSTGVTTPWMKAAYPTLTFPNHYTIVTGLYPESHGIITNHFYDENFHASFDLGDEDTLNGSWWGGDPIWNTVQWDPYNKKSATFFWPGSDADIEGIYPTHYYVYDGSIPFDDRISQVLDWLALPADERPQIITLYFDEPDHTAHTYGPDTQQVNNTLVMMDGYFQSLVDGIDDLNITDCVNIMLTADHGMVAAGLSKVINLLDYDPNLKNEAFIEYGPFGMLYVDDPANIGSIQNKFSCQQPELRQYAPSEMPTRCHFSNNIRIGDILFDLDPGYATDFYTPNNQTAYFLEGQHGYDYLYQIMQPFFNAKGPDFKQGIQIEPFENIEIYNLMCTLLGVDPAPNNGTEGAMYHTLRNPPAYPTTPVVNDPDTAEFPDEATLESRLSLSGCDGDLSSPPDWVYSLNLTSEDMTAIREVNFPFGIPFLGPLLDDSILLYQSEHITAFSSALKMPILSSFTFSKNNLGSSVVPWTSDVRLDSNNSPTCLDYSDASSVQMEPLFPRRFSFDNTQQNLPYLVSNALPMTPESVIHWTEMTYNFLPNWLFNSKSPLNVVVGPVFDNNFDSLLDNLTLSNSSFVIPSHLFMVVTRCLENVTILSDCSAIALDAFAFILPQYNHHPNCMSNEDYTLKFSAKVKDVETITGFTFFPNLSYEDRIRLELRIHSKLWYT